MRIGTLYTSYMPRALAGLALALACAFPLAFALALALPLAFTTPRHALSRTPRGERNWLFAEIASAKAHHTGSYLTFVGTSRAGN